MHMINNLEQAELLGTHLAKYPDTLKAMGGNHWAMAVYYLYKEIERLREVNDGSKTARDGDNR